VWQLGVGYLLKDRVADVDEFVDALERAAAGGTALDLQPSDDNHRRVLAVLRYLDG